MAKLLSLKTAEGVVWSAVMLALLLIVMFFILHTVSGVPVVGGVANNVATRASGANYGY